ncbi:MAG TPA: sugar phosphate isomerase/epimerase [Tepidisphaeraceae bacterium]
MAIPIALQLYTLRDLLAKDFVGTVKAVAKIGYAGVEMAGYGDLQGGAKEAKKILDDLGLKVAGNHAAVEPLEQDINKVMDENDILGNKNICIAYVGEERRKDGQAWKDMAKLFNKFGAALRKRGFDFGYHNHSFEFQKFDGKYGLDILWENSDPNLVKSELDTYWVQHGGEDPVAYMKKLGKRIMLLHMKDMAAGPEKRFAEVGTGILDFKAIVKAAPSTGAKWYIVEQDSTYETPHLQAVKTSYENLKKLVG